MEQKKRPMDNNQPKKKLSPKVPKAPPSTQASKTTKAPKTQHTQNTLQANTTPQQSPVSNAPVSNASVSNAKHTATTATPVPQSNRTQTKKSKSKFQKFLSVLITIAILSVGLVNIQLGISHLQNNKKVNELSIMQEDINRKTSQLIDDTKELRKSLALPNLLYEDDYINDTSQYDDDSIGQDSVPQDNGFSEQDILYQQIEAIYDDYNIENVSNNLSEIIKEYNIEDNITQFNFTIQQKNTKIIVRYEENIIASIHVLYDADYVINKIRYESSIIGTTKDFDIIHFNETFQQLHQALQKNIAHARKVYDAVYSMIYSQEISNLIAENRSYIRFFENDRAYIWRLYNITQQEIFYVEISKFDSSIRTNDSTINGNQTPKIIASDIKRKIITTNYKTIEENIAYNNLNKLTSYTSDKTFHNKLALLGLNISDTVRNDNDYYYLDISTVDQVKIGSLGILKANGTFWRLDKDDVPLSQVSIFDIMPPKELKKAEEQNILLVGSHNQLADTIILVHIDVNKKIKLVSIPRDLYYQGRKINWYFKRFSPYNFNKVLSNITGLPISQYVHVDMYAFVSIIDVLGGIEVYLQSPLIDPSYKVKENGKISYLHYDAGEHYFSGIEALRVARSRYSTNDFSRSVRQQAIIDGIQKKLNSVDQLSSFISAIKIIDKIKPYINTNISTFEIAKMVQKYRNAQITNRKILSTNNILYATYSNIHNSSTPASEVDSDNLGQWILLPKNNDWEALQNYIESFILK